MSDGSRWGPIYRGHDTPRRLARLTDCRLTLTLLGLAVSALLVMVLSVKFTAVEAEPPEAQMDRPLPTSNYTETGLVELEDIQILPSSTTEIVQEENDSARRSRAFEDRARIINRPVLTDLESSGYSPLGTFADAYPQLEGYRPPVRGLSDLMAWVGRPEESRPAVKFSGIYIKAEEADRPYLNGHAYVSDPFVKFKPSHPAEINQLAVEPHQPNRSQSRPADSWTGASQTQTVFHPYPSLRPRPLKLMLDIYPMQTEPSSGGEEVDPRTRIPRLSPTPSGRMIVHLNLYPKRSTRYRRRPGQGTKTANPRVSEEPGELTSEDEITTLTSFEDTTIQTTRPTDLVTGNIH